MEIIKKRIKLFRDYLESKKLDAFIIPSGDPHFGEYVQEHYQSREWLSGFTGSAGTLVVAKNAAALWTDSRYFVQASVQLDGSGITLMKMKEEDTPTIGNWLNNLLDKNAAVGIDSSLVSVSEYNSIEAELAPLKTVLEEDPFSVVRSERPGLEFTETCIVPEVLSGEPSRSKLDRVARKLAVQGDFNYILSTCDDIAWLCNIRGSDIPFNPLFYSYMVLHSKDMDLFVAPESLNERIKSHLEENGVTLHGYSELGDYLEGLDSRLPIIAPFGKTSMRIYNQATKNKGNIRFIDDKTPGGVTGSLKAIKNQAEIDGFRKAMVNDGIAWVRFWIEMEKKLHDNKNVVTEIFLAKLLTDLREENPDYKGESFSPIVAFGSNGAQPHYSPDQINPSPVGIDNFLLIDTGAHYPYGTTDTTRTFTLGDPGYEAKLDYTMVLRGMINLSKAVFPKGTRGASLDVLARGEVYKRGKKYSHGTGHGVGHYLCVHEGPQSIRIEENPVVFEPGMITSNEPAIYQENKYGIRIENLLICKKWKDTDHGEFYCFDTMTLVPIDKKGVIPEVLGEEYICWLNEYHTRVYKKLSPYLDESERVWLAEKTSDIGS